MLQNPQLLEEQKTLVEQHKEHIKAIFDGTATADQVRVWFEWVVENRDAIIAEISKLTVKQIKETYKYNFHSTKKAGVVNEIVDTMLEYYVIAVPSKGWFILKDDPADHLRERLAKLTDQMIIDYAAERKAKQDAFVRALTDPQTLAEFNQFLHYRNYEDLTPKQTEAFDLLLAEKHLRDKQFEIGQRAQVDAIQLEDGITLEKRKDWHTKKECDIWLVKPTARVDRDVFKDLKEKAHRFGGRWNGWPRNDASKHGFLFYEEADADSFIDLQNGSGSALERYERIEDLRQDRAATRLQELADRTDGRADQSLAQERLTNTRRRVNMALSAEEDAHEEKRIASIFDSIGKSLEEGKLRILQYVRHGTQVATLDGRLRQAHETAVRKENGRYIERGERRAIRFEDIHHTEWPSPWLHASDGREILTTTKGKRGTKWDRQILQALINTSNETIKLNTSKKRSAVWNLLQYMPNTYQWNNIRERFINSQRLEKMGIDTLPILRAALREFFTFRVEKITRPDKIRLMELDLVGRKIAGFFATPPETADRMVELAGLESGLSICEPSAGNGRLADAISRSELATEVTLDVYEVSYTLREILEAKGYTVAGLDFLESTQTYDRFIMNPPFENDQDGQHVMHAYDHLNENGRIVAIVSMGITGRQTGLAPKFNEWLDEVGGYVEEKLPAGTFRDAGTNVPAQIIVIDK